MTMGMLMCAPGCMPPGAPDGERTAERVTPHTAFANDKPTYDYCRGQGFKSFQAAAIVGNLDQESGIDPNISQQNGGPGRGIAQWSAGGRWDSDPDDNVVAFAKQQGKSPYDLGLQLDFIMYELHHDAGYGLAKLMASGNVADATSDFELDFEGCGIPDQCDYDSRLNYANDVLKAYGDDPVVPDAGSGPNDAGGGVTHDQGAPAAGGDMALGGGGSGGGSGAQPSAHNGCEMSTTSDATGRAIATWLVTLVLGLWLVRRRASR